MKSIRKISLVSCLFLLLELATFGQNPSLLIQRSHEPAIDFEVQPKLFFSIVPKRKDTAQLLASGQSSIDYLVNEAINTYGVIRRKNVRVNSNEIDTIPLYMILDAYKEDFEGLIISNVFKNKNQGQYISPLYQTIEDKIEELKRQSNTQIPFRELSEIRRLINSLPPSSQKINLIFSLAANRIGNSEYVSGYFRYLDTASKYLRQLVALDTINLQYAEIGKAYFYIGNFSLQYHFYEKAIQEYYFALEYTYKDSRLSQKEKFETLGDIYRSIAYVFNNSQSQIAYDKAQGYLMQASDMYQKAGEKNLSLELDFEMIESMARGINLFPILMKYGSDSIGNHYIDMELIQTLGLKLYPDFKLGYFNNEPSSAYLILSSIGTILSSEGYDLAALTYFQVSLTNALVAKNEKYTSDALYNIAIEYSLLGEKNKALQYADKLIELQSALQYPLGYYYALINKATIFSNLNINDSALAYVDFVKFNREIPELLTKPEYNDLITYTVGIKATILDSLKSDSATFYYNQYNVTNNLQLQNLASLLNVETECLEAWSHQLTTESFSTQKIIQETLKKNVLLEQTLKLEALNKALLISQDRDIKALKIANDSITLRGDSIQKKYLKDTNRILTDNRNKLEKDSITLVAQKNGLIAISFALAFAILVVVYFIVKNKQKAKIIEVNLQEKLRASASENVFREMVHHDVHKLVLSISKMVTPQTGMLGIENGLIGKIKLHTANVTNYVTALFDVKVEPIRNVLSEISLARTYAEAFKQASELGSYNFNIMNNISDEYVLVEMPVPTCLINYFIKNAIEHGAGYPGTNNLDIFINCAKINNGYSIIIEDNGCGLAYSSKVNGRAKKVPWEMAQHSIKTFNENNNEYFIEFSENSVFDKPEADGTGTIVILNFQRKNNGNKNGNSR